MNRNPSFGTLSAGMIQRQKISVAQAILNSRRIYVFLFNAIINLFRAGKDKKNSSIKEAMIRQIYIPLMRKIIDPDRSA
jgi:hypothetical protein